MMGGLGRRSRLGPLVLAAVLVASGGATASVKPRAFVVLPFDASALGREEQWLGEGVAQVVTLGLTQHGAVVQIERARVHAYGQPEVWGEAAVLHAARGVRAEAAAFGRIERRGDEYVVQARLLEVKAGGGDTTAFEPITAPEGELLAKIAALPLLYARTLRIPVTDPEAARIERAARPTTSLRAFELYARGMVATQRGNQEGNEAAVDLLARAIEADPNFVVAHYMLGVVHQALGNRWKAAAQYRASTQLDAAYPEPYKALGDLFLAAPRRLFDQAVEAYSKAIELRPFYADAYVGLGEARAAKGEVDGAIGAFQKALVFNPVNPKVYMSLGKIYYAEKGLYYESVNAYKRAIELDPQLIEARMGLGEVYEEKGLYKEAIEEYRRVIELDEKNTGALYNLALVYEKVDPREAIAHWERYIQLASPLQSEKDWVDVARQHLKKLKGQVRD
ncbi:MAG TPA: tetratricopeptide repeat protein [Methylomirabilota bacterium]|nr:tetratricopeptide repeat protein [Methylomirabilota bacterium]